MAAGTCVGSATYAGVGAGPRACPARDFARAEHPAGQARGPAPTRRAARFVRIGALIKTRALSNDTWSALSQATFEIAPKLALARETGRAVLRFSAVIGTSYSVETRSSFSGGAWHKLLDVFAPDNGTLEVTDPNPIEGNRFYRLVSPSTP